MDVAIPNLNENVELAYNRFSKPIRTRLLRIRELIYDVAGNDQNIGEITETLKWGEPSYLTQASKSGTTIRLSQVKDRPNYCGIYVHCQTSLIEEFRNAFGTEFEFSGNRAVLIAANSDMNNDLVKMFLKNALTYHIK